jgi:hypothetical protein
VICVEQIELAHHFVEVIHKMGMPCHVSGENHRNDVASKRVPLLRRKIFEYIEPLLPKNAEQGVTMVVFEDRLVVVTFCHTSVGSDLKAISGAWVPNIMGSGGKERRKNLHRRHAAHEGNITLCAEKYVHGVQHIRAVPGVVVGIRQIALFHFLWCKKWRFCG